MTSMFPKDVQNKIAKLHILAGSASVLNKLKSKFKNDLNAVNELSNCKTITSCPSIESKRKEGIQGLIASLQNDLLIKNEEEVKSHLEILKTHIDDSYFMNGQVPSTFAEQYENIIHKANLAGADIYDACVVYGYNQKPTTDIISKVEEVSKEHEFKTKVVTTKNTFGGGLKIFVYTTTKGADFLNKAINGYSGDEWGYSKKQVLLYAMQLQSRSIDEILELSFDHNHHEYSALARSSFIQNESYCTGKSNEHLMELEKIFSLSSSNLMQTAYRFKLKTFFVNDDKLCSTYLPIDEIKEFFEKFDISTELVEAIKE
ncbi:hypothetical protein [Vibrio sp. D431a]|uniref:hypothetical protein n=1 Tax=Vibrio sp. D431a TaxID=2837388 RepID=UPI00255302E4|nr:hypothetical protein [Vibrio sp. D431a]MDK9793358.1 hypothetical protein [Vibrio sp. D431a]